MLIVSNKPIHQLKAKELRWLAVNKCKHGHTYLEHYSCFQAECQHDRKVGFFDIEASDLDADVGFLLCYCIKTQGKDEIVKRVVTHTEFQKNLDKKIVDDCVNDLLKYDHIIGYYSTRYDLPFVRTRALRWQIPFPLYGARTHTDIYFLVRNKLKLTRNTLERATRLAVGKTRKTRFDPEHWAKIITGDKTARQYMLDHCEGDVLDTEDLYNKIFGFGKGMENSI